MPEHAHSPAPPPVRRVLVRLRPGAAPDYRDGVRAPLSGSSHEAAALQALAPGLVLDRRFRALPATELARLVQRARASDPGYDAPDPRLFFQAQVPDGVAPPELAQRLAALPTIDAAWLEPRLAPPPALATNPYDEPEWPNQGYFGPAPYGIGIEAAWAQPNGDGSGVTVAVLDRSWEEHVDLPSLTGSPHFGHAADALYSWHGTATLGVIAAVDNTAGVIGAAHRAKALIGGYISGGSLDLGNPVLGALPILGFGDVLLLEVQIYAQHADGTNWLVPADADPANRSVIRLATALGIVVIEAGANQGSDLDQWLEAAGAVLRRGDPAFEDTFAIVVAACHAPPAAPATVSHKRHVGSNYGSRIDCFAWGEKVRTTYSGNGYGYVGVTSGAAAIVAGAAAALQSAHEAQTGARLSPGQMRALLSDPAVNTPSGAPATDKIGVMPDLGEILLQLGLRPDLYIRDHAGDTGLPHSGPLSLSPDIIVKSAPVPDPTAAYGPASGTLNDAALSDAVTAGKDHSIYVRVWNRGAAAQGARIAVYWSDVATLTLPQNWTHIGDITLAGVADGASPQPTVSAALPWPAAKIPGPGHYCFLAIADHAQDPALPPVAELQSWDNFLRFIRQNNNASWRNFNVVAPSTGTAPPPPQALPFFLGGAPGAALTFEVRIEARLGPGGRLRLAAPPEVLAALRREPRPLHLPRALWRRLRKTTELAIERDGETRVGLLRIAAGKRVACRLLVEPGDGDRRSAVMVSQWYDGAEVGRAAWWLGG